jgi:hypothetical protein
MRKSKRGSDDISGQLKDEVDALEREIAFLKREIESITNSLKFYLNRLEEVESSRRNGYSKAISAKTAEVANTGIAGYLPSVGQITRQIGDIANK